MLQSEKIELRRSEARERSQDRLLTRRDIEARCRITRTTIYRLMRAKQFPEPIRLGPRAVRWHESEIEAWIESRPRATGDRPAV